MNFESLGSMLIDTGKIAFVVGLLVYIIRRTLPYTYWAYLDKRPYITNIFVVVSSIGLAVLGNWLNFLTFKPREIVELIYFGVFSAGMNSLGYEFIKNWAKEIVRPYEKEDEI